jgi:hypothetical protein
MTIWLDRPASIALPPIAAISSVGCRPDPTPPPLNRPTGAAGASCLELGILSGPVPAQCSEA